MTRKAAVKASKKPAYIYALLVLAALFLVSAVVLVAYVGATSEDYAQFLQSSAGAVKENPIEIIMRGDVEIIDENPPLAPGDIGGMHKLAACAAAVVFLICGAPLLASRVASRRLVRTRPGK